MIAFYAWTDTLLLNAARLKSGLFPDEEADLIVLRLDRISEGILKEVENAGLFARIVLIYDPARGFSSSLHKLTKLFRKRHFYRALTDQLEPLRDRSYRVLFTGGFWSYSLFVFRWLMPRSPALEVAFLEEGAASYSGLPTLLRCDPLGLRRSELYRRFFYADVFPEACRRVKELYLARPDAVLNQEGLCCRPLPPLSEASKKLLARVTADYPLMEYRRRAVIFFLQPEPEADRSITLACIREAADRFGAGNVLVKPHPSQTEAELFWLAELDEGCFVDRAHLAFDCIVDLVDWNGKLMIAKGTSCLLHPFYHALQEPAVLFTYDLYPKDPAREIPAALAGRLRELYTHGERVMTADSAKAFSACLAAQVQQEMKEDEDKT